MDERQLSGNRPRELNDRNGVGCCQSATRPTSAIDAAFSYSRKLPVRSGRAQRYDWGRKLPYGHGETNGCYELNRSQLGSKLPFLARSLDDRKGSAAAKGQIGCPLTSADF